MNNHVDKNVLKKYLSAWSEPLPLDAVSSLLSSYAHCVVIPAFDESITMIQQIPNWANTLTILVLNYPDNADRLSQTRTTEVYRYCEGHAQLSGDNWCVNHTPFNSTRLVLWAPNLPAHQGVGLARKIGFDLALHAFYGGRITSPWIHSTDADVQWPNDWLNRHAQITLEAGAALLPFVHKASAPQWHIATELYDAKLRYYVAGLRHANNPWAFHTVGSTIIVNIDAYAKVRGIPKKNAGEDFHLLRKISKIAPIISLKGTPLTLLGRPSSRVPFGTGPSIIKYSEHTNLIQHPIFYNPESFDHLKRFQQELIDNTFHSSVTRKLAKYWKIDAWRSSLNTVQQDDPSIKRQFFDSLKTLRTIHYLHTLLALPLLSSTHLAHHQALWLPTMLRSKLNALTFIRCGYIASHHTCSRYEAPDSTITQDHA